MRSGEIGSTRVGSDLDPRKKISEPDMDSVTRVRSFGFGSVIFVSSSMPKEQIKDFGYCTQYSVQ